MFYCAILLALCSLVQTEGTKKSPRIIIVGCGASGIAAATRLYENGFRNFTILEAENRIGGRVHTVPFGGYMVDLGGQWVHGEEHNVAFEMAWPLGLLERSDGELDGAGEIFDSSGSLLPTNIGDGVFEAYTNASWNKASDSYLNKSMGDYLKPRIEEFLNTQQELTADQRKSLVDMVNLVHMGGYAADNWFNLSMDQAYTACKGDQEINWKDKGYSMILEILMKKYPDPTQEIPILNHTVLNTEVSRIDYNVSGRDIRVLTANGDEYSADHVIVTPSIAVLKADYEKLFNPPLPEAKINAIKGIELGDVVKIYLSYPEPWWINGNQYSDSVHKFYWREEDKSEYANDPEKSWMLGLVELVGVENKPRLLCGWVTGSHAREMENIPDDRIFEQTKEFIRRFIGKTHNLTEPNEMLRSKWLSNKHFRGTWSYRSMQTARFGAKTRDLEEPIRKNGNPVILFAGEASHSKHPSTVHGAIGSGWREADRLIQLYSDIQTTTETQQSR